MVIEGLAGADKDHESRAAATTPLSTTTRAIAVVLYLHHARADPFPGLARRKRLKAGKHAAAGEARSTLELWEADELITIARRGGLKFTIAIRSASIPSLPTPRRRSPTARSAKSSP